MNNTIITCVVDNASVVGFKVNTVISCLDNCVEGTAPSFTLLTLQTHHLSTLNSINDVNDSLIPHTLN